MVKKLISLCLLLCIMLGLTACYHTTYTDSISDYLETNAALSFPEMILFPKKEAIDAKNVISYQSECKTTLIDDDVYFILSCHYDEDVYAAEIARFQECNAIYDDTIFTLPAYVMLLSGDNYEYALLDESNTTVIYVAAQTTNWRIFETFPEQYLPSTNAELDICQYANS